MSGTNYENIPIELRERVQWVAYRPGKVPTNPKTGGNADPTNPATWGTFDQAVAAVQRSRGQLLGIGYVFCADDPYCGIDLDHAIDPETGQVTSWAMEIVDRFASYTEISPSGTGLHIIVRGELPAGWRKQEGVEAYHADRYFTVTGNILPGAPATIEDRSEELAAWHAERTPVMVPTPALTGPRPAVSGDDQELLARARSAKNGDQFSTLYDRGDISGFPSASNADFRLAMMLRFWTGGDLARMERLMRASALRRNKWTERRGDTSYLERTLVRALPGPVYDPHQAGDPPQDEPEPEPLPAPAEGDDGGVVPWETFQQLADQLRQERQQRQQLERERDSLRDIAEFYRVTLHRKDLLPSDRIVIMELGPKALMTRSHVAAGDGTAELPTINKTVIAEELGKGVTRDKVADVVRLVAGESGPFITQERQIVGPVRDRATGTMRIQSYTVTSIMPQPHITNARELAAAVQTFQPNQDDRRVARDCERKRRLREAQRLTEQAVKQLVTDAQCPRCADSARSGALTARAYIRCDHHGMLIGDASARTMATPEGEPVPPAPPIPAVRGFLAQGSVSNHCARNPRGALVRVLRLTDECPGCGGPLPVGEVPGNCKACEKEGAPAPVPPVGDGYMNALLTDAPPGARWGER